MKKTVALKALCSIIYFDKLIGAQGVRLSARTGGQVRHLRVKRTNVAHRLPRGKRATWSGNQPLSRASSNSKTALKKEGRK
jgi:hypothetical protein